MSCLCDCSDQTDPSANHISSFSSTSDWLLLKVTLDLPYSLANVMKDKQRRSAIGGKSKKRRALFLSGFEGNNQNSRPEFCFLYFMSGDLFHLFGGIITAFGLNLICFYCEPLCRERRVIWWHTATDDDITLFFLWLPLFGAKRGKGRAKRP